MGFRGVIALMGFEECIGLIGFRGLVGFIGFRGFSVDNAVHLRHGLGATI